MHKVPRYELEHNISFLEVDKHLYRFWLISDNNRKMWRRIWRRKWNGNISKGMTEEGGILKGKRRKGNSGRS